MLSNAGSAHGRRASNNAGEVKLVGNTDEAAARPRLARLVDESTQLRMPRIPYGVVKIVGAGLGDLVAKTLETLVGERKIVPVYIRA